MRYSNKMSRQDMVTPSKRQKMLTKRHLEGDPELYRMCSVMRDYIDGKLKRKRWFKGGYPIGYCAEITGWAYDWIQNLIENDRQECCIVRFAKAGGKIHSFWGIHKDGYFHHAIQAGSYIINIAGNAYRKTDERIAIEEFSKSKMRNIESISDYVETGEKYWGVKFYPNTVYPCVALACPLICIRENYASITSLGSTMVSRIVASEYQWHDDYWNSPYARRGVPRRAKEALEKFKIPRLSKSISKEAKQDLLGCVRKLKIPHTKNNVRITGKRLVGYMQKSSMTLEQQYDLLARLERFAVETERQKLVMMS